MIALLARSGAQAGDVAAALGLGERQRAAQLARRQARKDAGFLFAGAVAAHEVRENSVRADDAGQAHPAARELLEDARIGDVIDTEPAEFRGHSETEEAELAHLL